MFGEPGATGVNFNDDDNNNDDSLSNHEFVAKKNISSLQEVVIRLRKRNIKRAHARSSQGCLHEFADSGGGRDATDNRTTHINNNRKTTNKKNH